MEKEKNLKKLKATIEQKIVEKSTIHGFAQSIGLRHATLYDFLHKSVGINITTLLKIISPLKLKLKLQDLNDFDVQLIEVQAIWIEKKKFKKGDKYQEMEVLMCFGDAGSGQQGMLLKDAKGKSQLVIV